MQKSCASAHDVTRSTSLCRPRCDGTLCTGADEANGPRTARPESRLRRRTAPTVPAEQDLAERLIMEPRAYTWLTTRQTGDSLSLSGARNKYQRSLRRGRGDLPRRRYSAEGLEEHGIARNAFLEDRDRGGSLRVADSAEATRSPSAPAARTRCAPPRPRRGRRRDRQPRNQ